MRLSFIKCHGSGNDFPLIDARGLAVDAGDWPGIARALADRRGPVGGDGLLLLTESDADCAFGMRMFNSDGSEAETCLNGLRCVARLGFERLGIDAALVRLRTTRAAVTRDPAIAQGVVTIRETAGPADLDAAGWIAGLDGAQLIDRPLAALPTSRRFTAVAMPNPHLVAFVDRIDEAELIANGKVCEAAPAWLPGRANVSFVERRGPTTLFVRTFERGVGLTDSCGSAMAASAYAAGLAGHVPFEATLTILNKGGLVRAEAGRDGMVSLSGNATFEWEGSAEIDAARGIAGALEIVSHHNDEIAAWSHLADAASQGLA
ncbi:diaminopimelate epimerase [Sphingomonas sp. AR_OL41]|uniref:diaminopimelate epimerase n=1 Tax=Sphingomonas sp. AR_OL41 TaxID=3042729 RepID=UPI0024812905|nr:diaminopimelate epimerase [Sphingomonas sp. AR_OL41]MDH7975545.1 diaminopimelate epimerase [Sphingomonas sp. AR_OL41]